MSLNNPPFQIERRVSFSCFFRYFLFVGTFLGCLFSFFWVAPNHAPLFFTVKRTFLFTFELSTCLIWGSFWAQSKEAPAFYWNTLPFRLMAATVSSVSPVLLLKTELFLGGGSLLLSFCSQKTAWIPLFIVLVWLFLLGPLLLSYIVAEFFLTPNTWFLISPLLWVPAQLGFFS